MRLKILSLTLSALILGAGLFAPSITAAQRNDGVRQHLQKQMDQLQKQLKSNPNGGEPLLYLRGQYTGNNPNLRALYDLQTRLSKSDEDYDPAQYGFAFAAEPTIPQVKFLKIDAPKTLYARIDHLLHGITIMLPPEHDKYGYEIRRYMVAIGGREVFADKQRLAKEIANTKRARIILNYWSKALYAEMREIQSLIESGERNITPSIRTDFKVKSGKAKAFIIEASSWIDNNRKMLEMLHANFDDYEQKDIMLNFREREVLNRFKNLYRARQKSLKILQNYAPFRVMVY